MDRLGAADGQTGRWLFSFSRFLEEEYEQYCLEQQPPAVMRGFLEEERRVTLPGAAAVEARG
jgi:hypothetical protein